LTKLANITGDFSGETLDPKWDYSYRVYAEGGRCVIPCIAEYAGLNSVPDAFDLTDSYLLAKVTPAPQPGNGTREFAFEVYADADNKVNFLQSGGSFTAMRYVKDGVVDQTGVSYDPVEMAWWRIRESEGTLYWETSPDGETWTIRRSFVHDLAAALTSVQINIYSGFYGTEEPSNAYVDNLNLAPGTLTPVTSATPFSWGVRRNIEGVVELRWQDLATVEATHPLRWDDRAIAKASFDLSYAVYGLIESKHQFRWNDLAAIELWQDLSYDVREIVRAQQKIQWSAEGREIPQRRTAAFIEGKDTALMDRIALASVTATVAHPGDKLKASCGIGERRTDVRMKV
jgi:hypothetical protein